VWALSDYDRIIWILRVALWDASRSGKGLVIATPYLVVDTTDEESVKAGVSFARKPHEIEKAQPFEKAIACAKGVFARNRKPRKILPEGAFLSRARMCLRRAGDGKRTRRPEAVTSNISSLLRYARLCKTSGGFLFVQGFGID